MGRNVYETAAELAAATKAANQQAAELIAEVKREDARFKDLCARKKAAVNEAKRLQEQLDALIAANKELFDAIRKA